MDPTPVESSVDPTPSTPQTQAEPDPPPQQRTMSFKLLAKREAQRTASSASLGGLSKSNLDGADPELVISYLQHGFENFAGLKRKLATCSDDWLVQFLDRKGLELIFASLAKLGERGYARITDAVVQLSCVGCIKAVMNSKTGLEYITDSPRFVSMLAQGTQKKARD